MVLPAPSGNIQIRPSGNWGLGRKRSDVCYTNKFECYSMLLNLTNG
jgi:hypothetical protein